MTNHWEPYRPDVTTLPLFKPTLRAVGEGSSQANGGPSLTAPSVPDRRAAVPSRDMDWALVASLRSLASEQLSQAVAAESHALDRRAQEELGRSIVLDLIEAAMADAVDAGDPSWNQEHQDAVARAVFDSLFRLGRLQPLVDDDRVENIIICGYDNVTLDLIDGSQIPGPPVADSDQSSSTSWSSSPPAARSTPAASPRLNPSSTCASTTAPAWRLLPG